MISPERDSLSCLLPLMRLRGVGVSLEEFHRQVNLTFHAYESEIYDQIHQPMWLSLPEQFKSLCDDFLKSGRRLPDKLNVLDVGCGTGLASELLLQTTFGAKISKINLLDTSAQMLKRSASRASNWRVEHELLEGTVEQFSEHRYDLIVACSFLHHVPDLSGLLSQIQQMQPPGGIFLHLHDPNGDSLQAPELKKRIQQWERHHRVSQWAERLSPARIARRLWQRLNGTTPKTYVDRINESLIEARVIRQPMTEPEIWSVTDIREDHPYSIGGGISVRAMAKELVGYQLVSSRSYGFFGKLESELPRQFQAQEKALGSQRCPNGRFVGGICQRRSNDK